MIDEKRFNVMIGASTSYSNSSDALEKMVGEMLTELIEEVKRLQKVLDDQAERFPYA